MVRTPHDPPFMCRKACILQCYTALAAVCNLTLYLEFMKTSGLSSSWSHWNGINICLTFQGRKPRPIYLSIYMYIYIIYIYIKLTRDTRTKQTPWKKSKQDWNKSSKAPLLIRAWSKPDSQMAFLSGRRLPPGVALQAKSLPPCCKSSTKALMRRSETGGFLAAWNLPQSCHSKNETGRAASFDIWCAASLLWIGNDRLSGHHGPQSARPANISWEAEGPVVAWAIFGCFFDSSSAQPCQYQQKTHFTLQYHSRASS